MFTQCPDCQTTFRVSPKVLEQADGRVRCGGCGNPFNALESMSPDDNGQYAEDDIASTEATPDQNKQLLETLEKLAGPEVELEDTGVEWRVLEKPAKEDADFGASGSLLSVVGGNSEQAEDAAVHGRQDDLPGRAPDAQESLDFPDTEPTGERRYDDDTVLPDNFGDDDDLDELPFLEAEVPKRRASDREEIQDTPEFNEAQVDLALGEPEEWVDLLDEVGDEGSDAEILAEEPAEDESESADDAEPESGEKEADDDEPPGEDMPSDINTQFLLQAEELGLDTGSYPVVEDDADEHSDAEGEEVEGDDLVKTVIGGTGLEEEEELSLEDDEDFEKDEQNEQLESTGDFKAQIAVAEKALAGEDESDISDEEIEELAELDIEAELAASDSQDDAAARETKDAIATAIRGGKDVSELFDEDSPTVETIVMEGEMFGEALDEQNRKNAEARSTFENPGRLEDTYSLSRDKIRGGRRAGDPSAYPVIAGVVVLCLLLLGQFLHQSRQSLARYGAFNHTAGSIYRVLGKPVTPEWDVRGWRFEATNGNVDEEDDLLTIYSRIANKSSQALPYPLVHISLTDRWEDVIGSSVLEPTEYLAGDLDPRRPVPADEVFTAVITIKSPSVDATGFRLAACYRIAPGRVRCADEHFKD